MSSSSNSSGVLEPGLRYANKLPKIVKNMARKILCLSQIKSRTWC